MEHPSGRIGQTDGEFSVCQWFGDGEHEYFEYVRRWVSQPEAVQAFRDYTHNVAAQIGITKRVMITDGGDCSAAEWEYGKGVVHPIVGG